MRSKEICDEGARRLLCAILEQCIHDWKALRRDGIIDRAGNLTGYWPGARRGGPKGGRREYTRDPLAIEETAVGPRGKSQGARGPEEVGILRDFLRSRVAAEICDAAGVEHGGMLESLGIAKSDPVAKVEPALNLREAHKIVTEARGKGWAGDRPEPEPIDGRKHNGAVGFFKALPDSDPELVEFRRSRNLSQAQAAQVCGVTIAMWHNAERKTRRRTWSLPT